jgi:hypothetical protein
MKKINFLLALCLSNYLSFAQTINTVAGNGTIGYSGDGGSALSAKMNSPSGVAIDFYGNLYIADVDNHCIRKVTSTGIISTIAGIGGSPGFSGDGGPATSAQLNRPCGVMEDSYGNIYITDNGNNRIRKVTSDGIISTVAGTGTAGYNGDNISATSAQLNSPDCTAYDGSNLYIVDYFNQRIRKVTLKTGIITTIAGNGTSGFNGDGGPATSARLNYPECVAVWTNDIVQNIYISDSGNHRIRKVTSSTGIITTVAGTGTAGYNGDNISATSAQLHHPSGIAVDGSQNIYIADWYNERIRQVTSGSGVITTIAGNGTYGFSGDGGPATSAQLKDPASIATNPSGIYFSDGGNVRVRAIGSPCPANAGVDKSRQISAGPCCAVSCTSVQIGTASTGYTYNWAPCDGTLSSCTIAQPYSSACNETYTLTVSNQFCVTNRDVVKVIGTMGGHPCCAKIAATTAQEEKEINIFPNPSDGKIMIETAEEVQALTVIDITGRIVYRENNIASNRLSIDLSKEAKGIYAVKLTQHGTEHIKKITIE